MVTYNAILNDQATIGSSGNVNKTILDYGESNKTTPSTTTTYTFGIPVFKYTGTEKTGLADAKFKLYTDAQCKDENEVKVKVKTNGTDYIVGDTDTNNNVMTSGTTVFNINGLKAGTYYLKEIEAPKGYNKLANAIEIEIENGNIKVNKNGTLTSATQVDVENKTGTVLPSTGGAGTTMIYLIGGALVLGSGVVLATKRRVKGK
ncbi:SpaA isopeptide-forming pilin-related protein [Holdemanella porci]|uniref:SpaA isopeptide-forming pilin-related protein n=2 Tax=Holdemanella porci TaxID=2652276 RepID=UPI003AB721FB